MLTLIRQNMFWSGSKRHSQQTHVLLRDKKLSVFQQKIVVLLNAWYLRDWVYPHSWVKPYYMAMMQMVAHIIGWVVWHHIVRMQLQDLVVEEHGQNI